MTKIRKILEVCIIKLIYIVLLLLSLLSSNVLSNDIKLSLDYSSFRYNQELSYVEIYYLINATELLRHEEEVFLEINILDFQTDSLLASQNFKIDFIKNPDDSLPPKRLGLIKSLLPEGKYTIEILRYSDENRRNPVDSLSVDANIESFIHNKITLSDIELCNNIIPQSAYTEKLFYKNTMEVIPNPTRIYTKNNPILYYYVELYNLKKDGHSNDDLHIQVFITDKDGQIRNKKSYRRTRQTESLVENGLFNISKLESGFYALTFAVSDTISNYSVYRRDLFYVDNPDVIIIEREENEEQQFIKSRYFTMDTELLDVYFEQASYIATKEEINIYNSLLDAESKRKFLFKFWKQRARENPGMEDRYYERVEIANIQFNRLGVEGWKTGMGRIYIVYGKPDEISRNPSRLDQNPYEIWYYYDIQGGVEFDFVDQSGYGDYRLVNSTHRNEIHDPDWLKLNVSR